MSNIIDDYLALDIVAGQALPGNQLAQLQSGSVPIRCITVNNNSSMTVGLYPGLNSPNGTPPITVAPFQTQTIPIASAKQIAVGYSGVCSVAGFVYIHFMDTPQTSNAAPLPTLQTPGAQQLISLGADNIAANSVSPITLVQWQLSTAANSLINSPTFTSQLYLGHLDLEGIPATNPGWLLFLINFTRSSAVSQYIMGPSHQTTIDRDFATPVKMYIPHAADQIGDIFRLIFQMQSGTFTAFELDFAVYSFLT